MCAVNVSPVARSNGGETAISAAITPAAHASGPRPRRAGRAAAQSSPYTTTDATATTANAPYETGIGVGEHQPSRSRTINPTCDASSAAPAASIHEPSTTPSAPIVMPAATPSGRRLAAG